MSIGSYTHQNLTPGEAALLNYFKGFLRENLLDIVRVHVTYKALALAKKIEFEILENFEKEVQELIDKNLFLLSRAQSYSRFSSLFTVFNNANCLVSDLKTQATTEIWSSGFTKFEEETEKGWLSFNYIDFENDLGLSKDTSKKCLDNLMRKGYIEKERGLGKIKIRVKNLSLVLNYMKSEPIVWFPVEYDGHTYQVKKSEEYEYMLTLAKNQCDFQDFFEKHVDLMINKLESNFEIDLKKETFAALTPQPISL